MQGLADVFLKQMACHTYVHYTGNVLYTEHIFIGYFSYWSSVIASQSYFLVQCAQLAVPLFKFEICLYIISLHSTVTLYLYNIARITYVKIEVWYNTIESSAGFWML